MEIAEFSAVIKEKILPNITKILDRNLFWGRFFTDGDMRYDGEQETKVRLRVQEMWSMHPTKEGETFPTDGQLAWKEFRLQMRKWAGLMRFTQEALEFSKGKYHQESAMKEGVKSFMTTMKLTYEMFYQSDGTGLIPRADITAAATGQVVPVTHSHYIEPGQRLMIVSGAGVIVAPDVSVTYKDPDAHEITLIGDLTLVDDTCAFYLHGSYSAAHDRSPLGLAIHVGDTNGSHALYQNYDRTVDHYMSGRNVYGSTPGTPETISTARIFDFFTAFEDVDRSAPRSAVTSYGVMKHLLTVGETINSPTIRWEQQLGMKDKGFQFFFNGEQIVLDMHPAMPANTMWALNKTVNKIYRGGEGFDNPGGSGIWRPNNNTFGVFAAYYSFWNTVCLKPLENGVLHDITEV